MLEGSAVADAEGGAAGCEGGAAAAGAVGAAADAEGGAAGCEGGAGAAGGGAADAEGSPAASRAAERLVDSLILSVMAFAAFSVGELRQVSPRLAAIISSEDGASS